MKFRTRLEIVQKQSQQSPPKRAIAEGNEKGLRVDAP